MGAVASSLGEPALYTFDGKDYKVSPFTFEIQAHFERYLEKKALEAYHRVSGLMSPEDAEKALRGIMADISAGAYTFGTPLVGKALEAPQHVRYAFFLCLKKNHPEGAVNQELVARMYKEDYAGMIGAMNRANADPNRPTPPGDGAPAAGNSQPPAGS